jgi:hypothetical protein
MRKPTALYPAARLFVVVAGDRWREFKPVGKDVLQLCSLAEGRGR